MDKYNKTDYTIQVQIFNEIAGAILRFSVLRKISPYNPI